MQDTFKATSLFERVMDWLADAVAWVLWKLEGNK